MTHNKKVLSLILALALMIALFAGCSAASASSEDLVTPKATAKTTSAEDTTDTAEDVSATQTTSAASTVAETSDSNATAASADTASDLIGETAAREIALADAGFEEDWVSDIRVKLDTDDDTGVQEYEVEFREGGSEYDYEINATTGVIISKSVEPDDDATTQSADSTDSAGNSGSASGTSTSTLIGKTAAQEIALEDAGLAESEVAGLTVKQDKDDGITVYEVEFYTSSAEYEYEINGTTGVILSRSVESRSAGTQTGSVIGETAAKETAFTHAGVSESSVSSLKVKLDTDDGIQVYEVEFRTSSAEYEYEINATTGAIISYEID